MPADEFLVEPCGFVGKDAGNDLDACFTQTFKAFSRNERVWVLDRANYPFDAGVYESFRAGRRFSVMAVRFERNISCAAVCPLSGMFEGDGLGVYNVVVDISPLTDDLAVGGGYHAANERIWAGETDAFRREFERTSDEDLVVRLYGCGFYDFFGFLALPRYFSSGLLPTIWDVRLQLDTLSDFGSVELE